MRHLHGQESLYRLSVRGYLLSGHLDHSRLLC